MSRRMLEDSLLTSDKIASLSDFEYRLWTGLILSVDDAGRGDARPAIIKGRVFPLRERVSVKDIEIAVHGLAAKGCISLYKVGGKSYFWFPTWSKHQRIRDVKPKYPAPPENMDCGNLRQSAADCGELRPELELELELKPEPELKVEADASCAEPETVSTPPVIYLPLNDGTDYAVSQEQCQEWAGLYPAVDVIQQLRNMKGWLEASPTRRKTKRGISRFIAGWLAREQNKGGIAHFSGNTEKKNDNSWMRKYIDQRDRGSKK